MLTLKQFLLEYKKQSRSVPFDNDAKAAIKWIEKNSPSYIKNAKKSPIFRGVRNNTLIKLINTSEHTRVSANTSNIYTELIDNSPKWKGYPKRSKSIICTTCSEDYIEQFGDIHLVIPKDNALVGICPSFDFWDSFEMVKSIGLDDMDGFNEMVLDLISEKNILINARKFNKLSAKKTLNDENLDLSYDIENAIIRIMNMIIHNNSTLLDELNNLLDPKLNKFKVVKAGQFKDTTGCKSITGGATSFTGKELWVEGECMLINLSRANNSDEEHDLVHEILYHFGLDKLIGKE